MRIARMVAQVAVASCLTALPCVSAEPPARPWSDVAELSLIITSGNSKTTNFAASNKFVYTAPSWDFTVDAAALRTETTTRVLSNPAGDVEVDETKTTTAEAYSLGGKYRHTIREGFLWYGAGGWLRNRFAGVDDRYTVGAGLGYRFLEDDRNSLVGEIGVDWTDESQVGGTSDSFMGARAFLGYDRVLSPTSKFTSELEVLENLDDTEDLRARWVSALTASVTSKLALKASYTVLYDRQPVQIVVPGDSPGVADASFEFDSTDTILSVSLVANL